MLEDTIPQHMETDHQQQQQHQLASPGSKAAASRSSVLPSDEGEDGHGQEEQEVPSPGRLDDFDFEGSLDAITTACPPPPPAENSEERGGEVEAAAAEAAGAESNEVCTDVKSRCVRSEGSS